MQILRKILFYLFVSVYFLVCPLTILYALGYIWRPGGEESLVKTGLIYLSTLPSGAWVKLGKNPTQDKTPTVLRDLMPGNYAVTIELKNFRPWSETLPVEAEKATVLEKILLLPKRLPAEFLTSETFDNLIPVQTGRFLILLRGALMRDCAVYDAREKKIKPFVPKDSQMGDFRILSLIKEEDSAVVVVRIRSEDGERFLRIKLDGAAPEVQDISDLFPEEPEKIAWDSREKDLLFSFREHSLNRLNAASKAIYPKIAQAIHGFGFFNKHLYVLDVENRIRIADGEGKNQELVYYNSLMGGSLLKEKYFYKLLILSDEDMIFLGEKGDLWTNASPKALVESGVQGVEISPPLKKALVWQRDKIGVIEFHARSVLEKTPEENPKMAWVHQNGTDIRQAFWVYEGSHILFRDGDKVEFSGLGTYGPLRVTELFRVMPDSGISYFEPTGKIYYLDRTSGRLASAEIISKSLFSHEI